MIVATILDVALCSAITVAVVVVLVVARFAALGRDVS